MICPRCHTHNRHGAKFCDECGFPLLSENANVAADVKAEESLPQNSENPSSALKETSLQVPSYTPLADTKDTFKASAETLQNNLQDSAQVLEEREEERTEERTEEGAEERPEERTEERAEERTEKGAEKGAEERTEDRAEKGAEAASEESPKEGREELSSAEAEKKSKESSEDDSFCTEDTAEICVVKEPSENQESLKQIASLDPTCIPSIDVNTSHATGSVFVSPPSTLRPGDTIKMPRIDQPSATPHKDFRVPNARFARFGAKKTLLLVILCVVVLGALIAGSTYHMEMWGGKVIPDVVGMTSFDATCVLENKGFSVRVVPIRSDEVEGIVLLEDPHAPMRQKAGSDVTIHVSVARTIPNVVGCTQKEAQATLAEYGYNNVRVLTEKSAQDEDTVLSISPDINTKAKADTQVVITVAAPCKIPDVIGMSWEEAQAALEEEGLVAECSYAYDETVEAGTVLSISPDVGQKLALNSSVCVVIAKSRADECVAAAQTYLSSAGQIILGGITYEILSVDALSYQGNNAVAFTISGRAITVLDGETVYGSPKQKSGIIGFDDADNLISIA